MPNKHHSILRYLIVITLALLSGYIGAQTSGTDKALPEVFIIGEHEEQYLDLSRQFPAVFMSVYNNDISRAYSGWTELLMDIEDYATEIGFDIKGTKLWLNLWFRPDGSVAHLAYYPKPNSRHIPEEHLIAFFKNFVRQYKLPVTSDKGFFHSAGAAFPTFFERTTADKGK